jgi:DNA-directed RNA polymerase specialized sigma24 family protein
VPFVEDIVQDSSLKTLEKITTFAAQSKFRTWAVTIAVRTAVRQMR